MSERNYKDYNLSGVLQVDEDYTVAAGSVYGSPARVFRREGRRQNLHTGTKGFTEVMNYSNTDGSLTEKYFVAESSSSTLANPKADPIQQHRRYIHDALGRMIWVGDRSEIRDNATTGLDPVIVSQANQSFEHGTSIVYGPDGEEILRVTAGNGVPNNGRAGTLILKDGPSTLVEVDFATGVLKSLNQIPGVGMPVSAIVLDRNGLSLNNTVYFRWDHRGTTLYTTNFDGDVVTDYRYGTPTGDRDLFGRGMRPGGVGAHPSDRELIHANWALFQPQGARADMALARSADLEERNETIASEGVHPAALAGGRNNYGFASPYRHIWNTQMLELAPSRSVLQGVIDFIRGMGDTISLGGTKYLREKIWSRDGKVIIPESYTGGMVAGMVVSTAIGFGAAGAAQAGTRAAYAIRAAKAYTLAGDVVGVVHSSVNLARGKFTPLDALGFLPLAGWVGGRSLPYLKGRAEVLALALRHPIKTADDFMAIDPVISKTLDHLKALKFNIDKYDELRALAGSHFDQLGKVATQGRLFVLESDDVIRVASRKLRRRQGLDDMAGSYSDKLAVEGLLIKELELVGLNPMLKEGRKGGRDVFLIDRVMESLEHAEGQAAWLIRKLRLSESGLSEAHLVINHPEWICNNCKTFGQYLMPEGFTLWVWRMNELPVPIRKT